MGSFIKDLELDGVLVRTVPSGSMDCVLKSQLVRIFANDLVEDDNDLVSILMTSQTCQSLIKIRKDKCVPNLNNFKEKFYDQRIKLSSGLFVNVRVFSEKKYSNGLAFVNLIEMIRMISLEPLICDLLNDNKNWKTFFCNKVNENMELDHKKCLF